MRALARLLLLAALPALAGRWRGAEGEVVSVTEGAGAGAGAAGAAGAAGPEFARSETLVLAAAGSDAELECRVRRLGDKAVSWVRSRDLQILSHAGAVFTSDARVSTRAGAARHALRIARLRPGDAGRYECQLNTEPKMSLFFNLTVLDEPVPVVVVRARTTGAAALGGAATLACEARYEPPPRALPLPPLDIRWTKDGRPVDLQSARGGVSLDTQRWAWRAESRLTLAALRAADAGAYACAAGPARDSVTLLVSPESPMEAMQRDESAAGGAAAAGAAAGAGGGAWAALLLAALRYAHA